MAYVSVPKDLTKVRALVKVAFNLDQKQLICIDRCRKWEFPVYHLRNDAETVTICNSHGAFDVTGIFICYNSMYASKRCSDAYDQVKFLCSPV